MSSYRGTKLKPCPFCGRSDTLAVHKVHIGMTDIVSGVHCNPDRGGCGATGGTGYRDDWQRQATEAEAVSTWNKRARP